MRLYLRGSVWWCWYYSSTGQRVRRTTRCSDREAAEGAANRFEREENGQATPEEARWFRGRFDSFVYFVQEGDGGPIKIGRASNAGVRLARMQTSTPRKLRLLVAVPGAGMLEASLHQAFRRHRLEGEWFEPVPRLLALVREFVAVWGRAEAASPANDGGPGVAPGAGTEVG